MNSPLRPCARAHQALVGVIASFDAYVFVTPEYNHGTTGALKNAIDFLYKEWNNKAAGLVSYGGPGGVGAVEQLRLIMSEVMVATVRGQVAFPFLATSRTSKPSSRRLSMRNTCT
jgi:NAD(P)H-dependent FMN reductase